MLQTVLACVPHGSAEAEGAGGGGGGDRPACPHSQEQTHNSWLLSSG